MLREIFKSTVCLVGLRKDSILGNSSQRSIKKASADKNRLVENVVKPIQPVDSYNLSRLTGKTNLFALFESFRFSDFWCKE